MPHPEARGKGMIVMKGGPEGINLNPTYMDFYQALKAVSRGNLVTRESWDNPKLHFKMHNGQVCTVLHDKLPHPLLVSQEDLDAEDYLIVDESKMKETAKSDRRDLPGNG